MENKTACALQNRLQGLITGLLAITLFIISSFISTYVEAATMDGSYHMILNGRSYHMDRPRNGKKLNENNLGSGVQYEFGRQYGSKWVPFVTSSAFSDSFNNLSYYAGGGETRRFYIKNGWHLDLGYVGFLMARKDINNYDPFPGILPVASMGTRNVSLNMTYVPDVGDGIAELIFFQLKLATADW